MQENETLTGGVHNGESANETATQMKERLRTKATAASEAVRQRAAQAQGWARSQVDSLQSRVEAEPYRASVWALGIGFIAGVVLTGLLRSSSRIREDID
jgi:ElaB/YqjD/DUF883 family membrane-anchored ribosome-binding protein